jgi:hypothetical protein
MTMRRLTFLLSVVAATLFAPVGAQADPVGLFFSGDGHGYVGLGGLGGGWDEGFGRWSDMNGVTPLSLEFQSGPLIDVVVEENDCPPSDCSTTTYTYEDGILKFALQWTNGDGSIGTGQLTAPLLGITSVVQEVPEPTQEGRHSQDEFIVGPGVLDLALARRLGVKPHHLGGAMTFYLEKIDEGPLLKERFGNLNEPFLSINVEVPEPASAVLMLGAIGAFAWRRRYRDRH